MKKTFKQFWKEQSEIRNLMALDFLDSDITGRMMNARDFGEWHDLYHQREQVRMQRDYVDDNVSVLGNKSIEKANKLSQEELRGIRKTISDLQAKGIISSKIITQLQKTVPKLSERWKAERAYWTEVKRDDTGAVGEAGEDLELEDYKIILSLHACDTCIGKSDNGKKIFKNSDINKSGYGHVPPFHPNCYCILVPKI